MKLIEKIEPTTKLPLPVIGNIRIGEKKLSASGKEYPTATDYFICQSSTMKQIESQFISFFGEKPIELHILFPNEDSVVEQYEMRDSKGGLVAFGDGKNFTFYVNNKFEPIKEQSKDAKMEVVENHYGLKFQKVLRLFFIIKGFPFLGLFKFETKADKSNSLIDTLLTVQKMAGRISGIEFIISVKMHKNQKAGQRNKYPVVSITPTIDINRMIEASNGDNQTLLLSK